MTTWLRACDTSSCVEVAYVSACGNGESCVEVLNDGDRVLVRNTQRPERVVEFTREEWTVFLDGVMRGVFDVE